MDNKKLTNGKIGKKMIQIAPSLDGKDESQINQELIGAANLEMGKPRDADFNAAESTVEPIFITAEYLMNKDVELDIRIVPNSSIKESATQKKNSDIAFFQMTQEDPMIDQVMNRQDLAEAFSKPADIVKDKPEEADPLQAEMEKAKGIQGGAGMEGMPAPGDMNNVNMDLL